MTTIRKGTKVSIHYRLTIDGEVVDTTEGAPPVSYHHGTGQLVPGLEERLEGCREGESIRVVVPPEKAYGPYVPENLHEMGKSLFTDPASTTVGTMVEGRTRLGAPFRAQVVEEKEDSFVVDLNHPLAGKYLEFDVQIVSIETISADP
jgi:FKBP-type peptidyl-prolyl cis-trans isomerase SlyD